MGKEGDGEGRERKGRATVRTCCWAALKISEPQWAKLLSVSMLKSLSGFACSSLRCSFARESQPVKRQGLNGQGEGGKRDEREGIRSPRLCATICDVPAENIRAGFAFS